MSIDFYKIEGTHCPLGLENTPRDLCEAVMEIDLKYFRNAVSDQIKLETQKRWQRSTVAAIQFIHCQKQMIDPAPFEFSV